jgi:hypothetical protein
VWAGRQDWAVQVHGLALVVLAKDEGMAMSTMIG